MFDRRSLTAFGLLFALILIFRWTSRHHHLGLNLGARHPLAPPASEITLLIEDYVRIVQRSPSPEVRERYDTFIAQHALILHVATLRWSTSPGFSLSLVHFGNASGGGHWGLLVSYETMTDTNKHKIRHYLQGPRANLQPLIRPPTGSYLRLLRVFDSAR